MSQEQNNSGSFSSGLVVGALAGAVAYFLSQTKEGRQVKDNFSSHWEELRSSLIKEGKLSHKEAEITDYIQAIRNKITEFLDEDIVSEKKSSKSSPTKKTTKSRKKKLFKGI